MTISEEMVEAAAERVVIVARAERHNEEMAALVRAQVVKELRALAAAPAPAPGEWQEHDPVAKFLKAVETELRRARAKFPGDRIMTIALAEEFGELAKAMLDEPQAAVWKEAVQTAVMAARVAIDGDSSVDDWRTAKGLDNHRAAPTEESKP